MQTFPIEEIVSVQPKGVLTIPKKIRDAMGIVGRGLVRMRVDAGKLTIELLRTLPYPVRHYTDEELAEFIAFDEEEGKKLRRKGIIK